jgi:hypothetical protein
LTSWQSAVFLLNSRLDLFAAAASRSGGEPLHSRRHPFFRSYGASLPSSLTWFLSRTLGYSPHPPVSVYGTGAPPSTLRRFSCQRGIGRSASSVDSASPALGLVPGGFACLAPHSLGPPLPMGGRPSLLRPSITPAERYRNINLLSIGHAFRPRLRLRLTLGGRTLPRKPWVYGDRNSHPVFRYSCLHGHPRAVHLGSRLGFAPHAALFYRFPRGKPAASVPRLSPDHFRRGITRPVSYYALFK